MSPALCDVVAVLRMNLGVCRTTLSKTSHPTELAGGRHSGLASSQLADLPPQPHVLPLQV